MKVLGIEAGDRVGTLAWNTFRHLALYFGVSGSGAVLHTVNPDSFGTDRLHRQPCGRQGAVLQTTRGQLGGFQGRALQGDRLPLGPAPRAARPPRSVTR